MIDAVAAVTEALVSRGLRLGVAESCTGGLLAARLTDPPGASRFLLGGAVVYANQAKESMLGVRTETIAAYGAVSGKVAAEMERGVRRVTGAEVGVAITGVAGPDGGTPDKPVGTVWIAVGAGDRSRVERFHFEGARPEIRDASVEAALEMIRALVEEAG